MTAETSPTAPVLVPRETINDETVTVVNLLIPSGGRVEAGQPIAEIETSKSIVEVTAPTAGYFHTTLKVGDRVGVGGQMGIISSSAQHDWAASAADAPKAAKAASTSVVTEPALRLMTAHGLGAELFAHIPLVRKSDVEAYLRRTGTVDATEAFRAACFVHSGPPAGEVGATRNVLIVGASGHGAVVADIFYRTPGLRLLGFADSDPALVGSVVLEDYKVIVHQHEVVERFDPRRVSLFIAVGDNTKRLELADYFAGRGFTFVNAIDPTAKIALGTRFGVGIAVMPHAVVGARASVGDHAIVNTRAAMDHDCSIGRGTHLAPGSTLGGTVTVGHRSLVGIGCSVNKMIRIGDDASIASGFTIYRDVPNEQQLSPKLGRIWW